MLCVGFGTGPLKDQIDENGLCPGRCNHTKVVDELDSKSLLLCTLRVFEVLLTAEWLQFGLAHINVLLILIN